MNIKINKDIIPFMWEEHFEVEKEKARESEEMLQSQHVLFFGN